MGQQTRSTASLVLGLLSVSLTLGVWAYIISREPQGAFNTQGGMMITFILFPMTFLGWAIGGIGAITLGTRAMRAEGASSDRSRAVAGIILGVLGGVLSLGTCTVPQVLADMLFGHAFQ